MKTLLARTALYLPMMLCAPSLLYSQGLWLFESRPVFEPLRAGVRDVNMSAAIGWADRVEFLVTPDERRFVWDIDVGAEMPIVGWESQSMAAGELVAGAHAVGLWFPISFHMIEDLAGDESNPIINNDYRFGLMGKAAYGLTDSRSVGLRLHVGHESTHLGDEFSIAGQRAFPQSFERINVSWEYLDVTGQLRQILSNDHWYSIRLGVTSTLPLRDTYYSTGQGSLTESPRGEVTPSRNWFDPHVGVEYEAEGLLGQVGSVYASTEIRWRSIYDYHKPVTGAAEDRQMSINFVIGARKSGYSQLGRFSPFVRFYQGVNPHGQFRNQRDFSFVGFGIRLTH